jgi:hypothetical protein
MIYSAREDKFIHLEKFNARILDFKSCNNRLGVMTADGFLKIIDLTDFRTLHSLHIYEGPSIERDLKLLTFKFDLTPDMFAYVYYHTRKNRKFTTGKKMEDLLRSQIEEDESFTSIAYNKIKNVFKTMGKSAGNHLYNLYYLTRTRAMNEGSNDLLGVVSSDEEEEED